MIVILPNNTVIMVLKVIGGWSIATDNLCKTFNVLKSHIKSIKDELEFYDHLMRLLDNDECSELYEQIKIYKIMYNEVLSSGEFDNSSSYEFINSKLSEILTQTHSMVLDPVIDRDNFIKSSVPTFSLEHKRFGDNIDTHNSILGTKLRVAISSIEQIRETDITVEKFKKQIPDIELTDKEALSKCKEAWLRAGFNDETWQELYGALEDRIQAMIKYSNDFSSFNITHIDKEQLIGALDVLWPIIFASEIGFNSIAFDIFTSPGERKNKIDKISVLTQFFLATINIYLKEIDKNTPNMGIIFDANEYLSEKLASIVKESLENGVNVEHAIISFINQNFDFCAITPDQESVIRKIFICNYSMIKTSTHFDEFFVLPTDPSSPWFSYGGAFSTDFSFLASKFPHLQERFSDFISLRSAKLIERDTDNNLIVRDLTQQLDFDNFKFTISNENIDSFYHILHSTHKNAAYVRSQLEKKLFLEKNLNEAVKMAIFEIGLKNKDTRLLLDVIASGLDVNKFNQNARPPIFNSMHSKLNDVSLALVRAGANLNIALSERPSFSYTPLVLAIKFNNIELVTEMLRHGANANYNSGLYASPLTNAARNRNYELVDLLLENGADINLSDAIESSIINEQHDMLKYLLSRGGNPNLTGTEIKLTPNDSPEIMMTLIAAGADCNAIKYDEEYFHDTTPLIDAIYNNHIDKIRLLIENGADVNLNGVVSPVIVAVSENNLEALEMLIDANANLNELLESSKGNYTALHLAIHTNNDRAAKILLDAGADYRIKNHNGEDAIDHAFRVGNEKVLDALGLNTSPRCLGFFSMTPCI